MTRRDPSGRKIRRRPHLLSMTAAAQRRLFAARQAEIAAGSNRDDDLAALERGEA